MAPDGHSRSRRCPALRIAVFPVASRPESRRLRYRCTVSKLRAVGFDLDGTLFDHRGSATVAVDAFVRTLGADPSTLLQAVWFDAEDRQFERWRSGEITFEEQRRERLRKVLPAFGVATPSETVALDALFQAYLAEYERAWRGFPDNEAVLTSLRRDGLRVGVLTNGNEAQQRAKLRALGLLDLVDVVCVSESIGVQKPDARAFQFLADRLGAATEDCLFVGDNPSQDVAGARAAGMRSTLIERYGSEPDDLGVIVREALLRD